METIFRLKPFTDAQMFPSNGGEMLNNSDSSHRTVPNEIFTTLRPGSDWM